MADPKKKKKKPSYVEKADEVTKKVDKAVGDAVSKLPGARKKVSGSTGRAASTDYKVPQQDILSQRARKTEKKAPGTAEAASPKKAASGGARPEKPGSYPKATRYGSNSPKNTDKGTGFGGSPKTPSKISNSPKTRGPTKDYGDTNPPKNPGSAGKTKQPVKAGQDPNAAWRRAQLTGQGDRWDATRGKMKRAGSNR